MGQRLTIYDFSKIMNAPDDLDVWDISRSIMENQPGIEKIHFKWEWQGYSGFGDIYLKNGIIDCDNQWCRDSNLTISSDSKKQATKHYSVIYNEPSLINVFEHINHKYL